MRAIGTAVSIAVLFALSGCVRTELPVTPDMDGLQIPRSADVSASSDPVIVAAGDIVCGNNTPAGTACKHAETAGLIGSINPNAVLLLGDNQYEDGTYAEYNVLYGPTWGQYKSITYPSVGNHEYNTPNASGYFDYFNGVGVQVGQAGDRAKGYYSFNIGAWHVVALNSNCGNVGGCGVGSAQEVWLKADLAANSKVCTLAYWHHPRFSSGVHGNNSATQALWDALYIAKADLILAGHDHNYERFAPMTATGVLDNTAGIRSFVVGTGGKEQRSLGTTKANSVVRSNNSFGVLKLSLHPTSYDWQFVSIAGNTLADAGSSNCVGLPPVNQAPTASITAPVNNASFVQGASVAFTGGGSDPEDGALGGASLAWSSNLDGAIGTGTSFSKSNLTVGVHTISLVATDAQGSTGSAIRSITITAPVLNQKPVAAFSANCVAQARPNQCSFDASASTDDKGIVSYTWNYGSGTNPETRTAPTAYNVYPAPGTYSVTLTVTDAGGLTDALTKSVTVNAPANQLPVASISAPAIGASFVQGATITFTGAGSDAEDGALSGASLTWTSSRDGAIGTGASFTNSSLTVGSHTITLTAKDSKGATGTSSRSITITAPAPTNQAPVASFVANCSNSPKPHTCNFDASASTDDKKVVSYRWDYGNSLPPESRPQSTSKNIYPAAGTYTVTLTVIDASGLTGVLTKQIVVP